MWFGLSVATLQPPTRSIAFRQICSVWQGSLFQCIRPAKTSRQRLVTHATNFRQSLRIVSISDTKFRVEVIMCVPEAIDERLTTIITGFGNCEGKCSAEQRAACPAISMMAALKSNQQTVPGLAPTKARVTLNARQSRGERRRYRTADRVLKTRRNQKSRRRHSKRMQRPLLHGRASRRMRMALR